MPYCTPSKAIGLAAALMLSGAPAHIAFAEPVQLAQAERSRGGERGGGPPLGRGPSMDRGAPQMRAPAAPQMERGPSAERGPRFDRGPAVDRPQRLERSQRMERFDSAPAMRQDRVLERRGDVQLDRRVYDRRIYDRNLRYGRRHVTTHHRYNYNYRHRYPFVYLGGPRVIVRGFGPGWCRGLHRGYHWAPRIGWHYGRHFGLYRCW